MYIENLTLTNIRNFKQFTWKLSDDEPKAGWHVLLGDNGAGKSTVLRALALAMLDEKSGSTLTLSEDDWITKGESRGKILLEHGKRQQGATVITRVNRVAIDRTQCADSISEDENEEDGPGFPSFSASFGPFRRFSGSNEKLDKTAISRPWLARHLSLFYESFALNETLTWLKELDYQELSDRTLPENSLLNKVKAFINQEGLLPNRTKLTDISPKGIIFVDASGTRISIEYLSDGFRSILSLMLELIRLLSIDPDTKTLFSTDMKKIITPGVVLIDEIDVHLHPRWQRAIGPWLTCHFPNIQFIVTTHSPLVCQGAMPGTVTRLPQPGVEDDKGERIAGVALDRLLYGDILEAISSGAFGSGIERSEEGQQKLQRLALLNRKARRQGLDDHETEERQQLQAIFGSDPD